MCRQKRKLERTNETYFLKVMMVNTPAGGSHIKNIRVRLLLLFWFCLLYYFTVRMCKIEWAVLDFWKLDTLHATDDWFESINNSQLPRCRSISDESISSREYFSFSLKIKRKKTYRLFMACDGKEWNEEEEEIRKERNKEEMSKAEHEDLSFVHF